MPADDTTSPLEPAEHRAGATTLYTVTVTSPATGRVQTVQVPAHSAQSAFPIACAWYPLLPLTGAEVEVAEVKAAETEPRSPAPAARRAA